MITTYETLPDPQRILDDWHALTEPTLHHELILKGTVVRVERHDVALASGRTSKRELVYHNGGAAILPIDDEGYVYLVCQYRKAVEAFLCEIPAGKLEPSEDPYDAAIRELREETGLLAKDVRHLGTIIPTAGYCSERIYCYLATGLTEDHQALDEDEYVSVIRLPLHAALEAVRTGQLEDAKTCYNLLMAAQFYGQGGRP